MLGFDEVVVVVVVCLDCYVKYFIDNEFMFFCFNDLYDFLLNQEFWSCYYNEVIEDEKMLFNVFVEDVGWWFDDWIKEYCILVDYVNECFYCFNGRFCFCLLLDQESIDKIFVMFEDLCILLKVDR